MCSVEILLLVLKQLCGFWIQILS